MNIVNHSTQTKPRNHWRQDRKYKIRRTLGVVIAVSTFIAVVYTLGGCRQPSSTGFEQSSADQTLTTEWEIVYAESPQPMQVESQEEIADTLPMEEPTEPCFEVWDIPLDEEYQLHTWELCNEYDVPYEIITALMYRESRFTHGIIGYNKNGTKDSGIMQINDINRTWLSNDHGLNVDDYFDNIECGILMVSTYWHKYSPEHALLAYGMGEYGMLNYEGTHYYSESLRQVHVVLDKADEYKSANS